VLGKLKEIDSGKIGINIFSTKLDKVLKTHNSEMEIPLASAAKVVIGFCIAKWVEEGLFNWDSIVENISFNPNEDSKELYPHFQRRSFLPLREAVEVMIACHDSFVAKRIVHYCGGWRKVNQTIKIYFSDINVTECPRDCKNKGQLDQALNLIICIYQGYKVDPLLWTPIINGLVRQKGDIEGIPVFHLNHMTGGLENAAIDIGLMGDLSKNPFIFALGAINLPNRFSSQVADHKILEAMRLLYAEYKNQ
jgi:hypothetical protein